MKKEPKTHDDDDGRVIVNMDVEGMRGHDHRVRRDKNAARPAFHGDSMTRSEARLYTCYSVLAALFVVLVFSLALVLFTLFSTQVWFR